MSWCLRGCDGGGWEEIRGHSALLCALCAHVARLGVDQPFRLGPVQVDMQQAVFGPRARHFHPIGQHETALKLARRDPAMQEDAPLAVVALAQTLVMLMGGIDLAIGATVSLGCVLAATYVGDSYGGAAFGDSGALFYRQ